LESFLSSELGEIYQSIPWDFLVKEFKLTQSRKLGIKKYGVK